MKRAKAKNAASKKYYVSEKQLNRIKEKVTKEVTDKVCLLFMVAAMDEFKLGEDDLCSLMKRVSQYTKYIDQKLVKMEEVRQIIEKNTGMKLTGWG